MRLSGVGCDSRARASPRPVTSQPRPDPSRGCRARRRVAKRCIPLHPPSCTRARRAALQIVAKRCRLLVFNLKSSIQAKRRNVLQSAADRRIPEYASMRCAARALQTVARRCRPLFSIRTRGEEPRCCEALQTGASWSMHACVKPHPLQTIARRCMPLVFNLQSAIRAKRHGVARRCITLRRSHARVKRSARRTLLHADA
jgi:hypothetical protein